MSTNNYGTHAADCWSWGPAHYDCAVGEIKRLRAEVERLRADGASAVRWAPGSAYWSEVLKELFGPNARDGIAVLETRLNEARERADQLAQALKAPLETAETGGPGSAAATDTGRAQQPAAVDEAMVARGFTLIELLIVISIVGFLVAVGVGWYSDSQRPTIELKKDDWECVKSEQRTSLQPILVGNATTLLPMTSTVCVQYNRRAD